MTRYDPIVIRLPAGHQKIVLEDSDGRRRAEVFLGKARTEADWEAEVKRSNAARSACRWFAEILDTWAEGARAEGDGSSQATRDTAWAAGLRAGLLGECQVLGGNGTPESRHPPSWDRKGPQAFRRGWAMGDAIRRASSWGAEQ